MNLAEVIMSKKGRILVAMSGGIDSSLAAVMLHDEGYEVIGMTMKTWDYAGSGGSKKETGCCSLDSINDARNIAVQLGFPHFILDIREEFGDYVINHFTDDEAFDNKLNFTFNKAQKREVRAALSNTFGFGGHNASAIFTKA